MMDSRSRTEMSHAKRDVFIDHCKCAKHQGTCVGKPSAWRYEKCPAVALLCCTYIFTLFFYTDCFQIMQHKFVLGN